MRRSWIVAILVSALAFTLGACSDPEASARGLYNEGITLQREGRTSDAIAVYEGLVRKYPRTEAAVEANKLLFELGAIDRLSSALSEDIDRKKFETAENHVRAIEASLHLYRLDNFAYPTQAQGLHALSQRPSLRPEPRNYRQGGYMRAIPKDPWGRDYMYRNPGNNGEFDVWTLTPDGEYIGNWNLSKR